MTKNIRSHHRWIERIATLATQNCRQFQYQSIKKG